MKKNFYIYLFVLVAIVLIQSCAVGPNYHKPETEENTESFRYASKDADSIINLKWWKIFDDPVLDTLIYKALANNKNLLIAASKIEQARANVGFTNADKGPKFSYNASGGSTNFPGNSVLDNSVNSFSVSTNVSWELDFWGKYRRASEAAKAELLSSFYGKRAVEIGLISEVATNYFKLLDYRTELEISESTLASRDSTLQIIQARFDEGYTHIIDVNQAQIQKAIAQAAVPQFKRFIGFTENNLSVLLGESPDVIRTYTTFDNYKLPDSIPTGLPSEILQRRPDILQASQNYHTQNANIGVAQAMRFPSISLTGLLGVGSGELSTLLSGGLGWGAAAGITGPLFEFGKNARRVDIAREVAKQSLLTYEFTVLNSMQEVSNALLEIETLKAELEARQLQLNAARNASYLSGKRYYQGVTSYLEVIDSQQKEFQAELAYSDNFQTLLSAHVKLFKALGGGWVSQEEIDKYAQQVADEQNVDVSTIDKDALYYNSQIVDLELTDEELTERKAEKKRLRKEERAQKKADRQNKNN
ncbi:MAG: transporter [Flavobacterium sp.]|nr:MAG: transporter [Flavobacterium sp.]